jgi:flavin prenyltransferase
LKPLILGITGASGLIYAIRAIKYLLEADYQIELVASRSTYMVFQAEDQIRLPSEPDEQEIFWREQAGVPTAGKLRCHRWGDVGANIASGSFRTQGMIIIPCSMSTVGKLAAGLSGDLLERAADVHLRNLTALAEAGAAIVPACPAWYHKPQSIDDLVDFVIARALDRLDIDCIPINRWKVDE